MKRISKKKILVLLSIFLIFLLAFNLKPILNGNSVFKNNNNHRTKTYNDRAVRLSDISLNQYSGIGKAQNITEYGEGYFLNNDINISNNENATIIVPNEWEAKQVNFSLNNLYERDNIWVNETFDTGIDYSIWKNQTDSTAHEPYIDTYWYNNPSGLNDSITLFIDHIESGPPDWYGADPYLNYTFYLDREHIEFQTWDLNFRFKLISREDSWLTAFQNSRVVYSIEMGINSKVIKSPKLDILSNNTWYNDSMDPFIPDLFGLEPPGQVSLIFMLDCQDAINPNGNLTIYFDNITLKLQTIPKPTSIALNITDHEHLASIPITDIDYGKGYVDLINTWAGDVGGKIYEFGFESNSSADLTSFSEFDVKAISSKVTSTELTAIKGSEFSVENETSSVWTMYFPVSIPGSYAMNYYVNISKPLNWNVTQVIDPYSNNKINDVIGAEVGSSTLTIPNYIVTSGVWQIVAEAPNYVKFANVYRKDGITWNKTNNFYVYDKLKFNATIKTSLIPNIEYTKGMLKIFGPNGSLWHQEGNVSVDINGNVEFTELTIGVNNASTGKYSAQIIWNDNNLNMSQVGFKLVEFNVIHNSNLTAIDSYFERIAGEPLLLKVKFIDSDLNTSIAFATITYNSTFGSSGAMVYQGLGEYISEIDTNSLGLGDYYFSFNALKSYYQNQSSIDLIHLKIIAQPLALEVPKTVISGSGNDYISCQVNVTGAFSGTFIWPANISTNWQNPYTVTDHYNGTFTLNFSTWDLPSQGILETFTVTIFASATDYGNTTGLITITVYPIQTVIEVNNSLISVYQNDVVKIRANYTDASSNELISGANCSVSWQGSYIITPINNEFDITFNTSGLAIDYYSTIIKCERPGYETAFKSITVIINAKEVNLSVSINSIEIEENSLIEAYFKQQINISVRVSTIINPEYLSGGLVILVSDNYQENLTESPSTYFKTSIILDGAYFNPGINTIFLRFEQTNYTTAIFAFQLFIQAQSINLTVQINNQEISENYLGEFYFNQLIHLSCRAFAEIEARFLSGGNITFVNGDQEKELIEYEENWFNVSILISNETFSLGPNNVYIRFEQSNYSTTIFTFQLYIREQSVDLTVQINYQDVPENYLFEISYNQRFHLSCCAFAEIGTKFLSGGTITFVNGDYEIELIEYEETWFNLSILVSASTFSLGPNYAYIRFQQSNYTTTTFSIQIFVNQIEIEVDSLNFQEVIEGIEGDDIIIRLRLIEDFSSDIIANATIFYSWDFGVGNFEYVSNGTYEVKLSLPTGYSGNYPFRLVVSMESAIYKSFEYSLIINIIQRELPNYFIWIIIISLIVIISILGILSLRSYVLLPRKREKQAELLAKTQGYKDVMNIDAFFISQRHTGLHIFSKDYYYITQEDQSELLTGFIHAITLLSTRVAGKEELKEMAIISKDYKSIEKIIELDFKHFNFFISDYKDLRITFILKEKASERFKNQTAQLVSEIDSKFSEKLKKWDGNLKEFDKILPSLFNKYFQLYYRELFKLNNVKYINRIQREENLSKMELRLLNVIISMTKERKEFYLEDAIKNIHEKNKDKVIEALESLIQRKIVIPSEP